LELKTKTKVKTSDPVDFSTVGVAKLVQNVQTNKATGPDGIPAHLLEVTADEAAVGLQLIFKAAILLIIGKPEAYMR